MPPINIGNQPQLVVYAANAKLLTTNRVFHDDLSPDIRLMRSILRTHPAASSVHYIPYLLPRMDSGELLISKPHYVRFHNGLGIAFVTAMGMPVFTITNKTPVYWMFRGLASNDRSVVAINMPLRVSGLSNARPAQFKHDKRFPAYAATIKAKLDSLSDTGFTPYLSNLDKIAASLNVNPRSY